MSYIYFIYWLPFSLKIFQQPSIMETFNRSFGCHLIAIVIRIVKFRTSHENIIFKIKI